MKVFYGFGVNDLLVPVLSTLVKEGNKVSPRGQPTLELDPAVMRTFDPRKRMLFHRKRKKYNLALCLAEVLWILSGRDDVEMVKYYNPRMAEYSDDGITFNAPYGHRLRKFPKDGGYVDQLEEVYNRLKEDPSTRRAAAIIFDPRRDYKDTKDVPCNNWLHFTQREGNLNLNVVARSNDAYWGALNTNYMQFSHILEVMAGWLGLEVGTYTVFTSSLHIYEERLGEIKPIIEDGPFNIYRYKEPFDGRMPKEEFDSQLQVMMDIEKEIRTEDYDADDMALDINRSISNRYWQDVMLTLLAYTLHKRKDFEGALLVASKILNEYRDGISEFMLRRYLGKDEDKAGKILQIMTPEVAKYLTSGGN